MIGETLYVYDGYSSRDRRWREVYVIGETPVSWLLKYGDKVDKKTMRMRGRNDRPVMTAAQRADQEWDDANRGKILHAIERADIPTRRKIAALLGID